jgi:hypothetical protein
MNHKLKFVIIATVVAVGSASPVLARSHSARTCACSNPQSVQQNAGFAVGPNGPYYAYVVSPYYDYVPGLGVQPYWPSAAAMGNSH